MTVLIPGPLALLALCSVNNNNVTDAGASALLEGLRDCPTIVNFGYDEFGCSAVPLPRVVLTLST